MSESCYLLAFGDQSDAFFRFIGIDEAYRAGGHSLFTVQTMIFNLAEAHFGDRLDLSLQLLDANEKRLHIFHHMHNSKTGELLATGEQMLVHVELSAGRSAPMPADLHARIMAVQAAHSVMPKPSQAGRSIVIRRDPE
jgi:carnitine 3-dehydrogenase